MARRLSELYGMDIYTGSGKYVGRVEDVILNLERGEVMRLSLRSFKGDVAADDGKRILQDETLGYNEVVSVGDIILCQKGLRGREE
ncbi:MAG: PRC-barrel domain-containing protein [Candidatus Altiarchaeota archaeon]|jgi:sporulation protein YlmC with PRC-barrel domain|nr:PRC-barrel domain-containing protein [Candidatus Altiarchaeota archaeon]